MNTLRTENLELDQIKFLIEALDWAEHFCESQAMHKHNPGPVIWRDRAVELARVQSELRTRFEQLFGYPPHLTHPVDGLPCHYDPYSGQAAPPSSWGLFHHPEGWEQLNQLYQQINFGH